MMIGTVEVSQDAELENDMETGFEPIVGDDDFASRSARYLAKHGYKVSQITSALVEQLDLSQDRAANIAHNLAA